MRRRLCVCLWQRQRLWCGAWRECRVRVVCTAVGLGGGRYGLCVRMNGCLRCLSVLRVLCVLCVLSVLEKQGGHSTLHYLLLLLILISHRC